MIDPATGWFEMMTYDNKKSFTIASIVEQNWLTRYPWPNIITYDRGSEFIGHEFKTMVTNDYGIKVKVSTTRNPQSNSIIERIHQVIGNMIRTFDLENVDEDDPWGGILAATSFAVRSTYHTTLKATPPGQLVFGRDMIFNINHIANWEAIKARKTKLIVQNNNKENSKCLPHKYEVGQKVLYAKHDARKLENPFLGPYVIVQVYDNGNVMIKKGIVLERVNIRKITPYKNN